MDRLKTQTVYNVVRRVTMKKTIRTVAFCIMAIFVFAACGQTASAAANDYLKTLKDPAKKKALSMGTGSSSGVWYIIGGGVANAVNKDSKWFTITSEAASGGGENLRNMKEGNIELAMLNCDMGYYFYSSTGSYDGKGDDKLRSLIAMPSSTMHVVVRPGSGIASLQDLKGKRVAVGTAGSGYENFARSVITCAGLTYNDMKVQMISPSQFADAMKNGQIDAFFFPVQTPGSAITELTISADVEILSLPKDFTDKFLKEFVGYVLYTIPANTYKGQDKAVTTLATGQFLSTLSTALTADEVYVLLSDIFNNRKDWENVHVSCAELTDTNIASLIVPLHAGAVKFYSERGVNIPKELIPADAK